MPGLNRHSKLYTPNQLLWAAIIAAILSIWFFEIPIEYHMRRFLETMRELARFVIG